MSTLAPWQCINPLENPFLVPETPFPRTSQGQRASNPSGFTSVTWLGQDLSSQQVPALSLAKGSWCLMDILRVWQSVIKFPSLPTLKPRGPAISRVGQGRQAARRAKATTPGTRVLLARLRCIVQRVLYACSFDKNKSSRLQFALNYIKVSAELTAPSEK